MAEAPSQSFSQETRVENGVVIWSVNGVLNQKSVPELKKTLGRLLHEGHKNIIFDFEELRTLDSQGIGFFISAMREIRERRGKLVLLHVDAKFAALFELTLLNRIFEMFTDLETAIRSFGPQMEAQV